LKQFGHTVLEVIIRYPGIRLGKLKIFKKMSVRITCRPTQMKFHPTPVEHNWHYCSVSQSVSQSVCSFIYTDAYMRLQPSAHTSFVTQRMQNRCERMLLIGKCTADGEPGDFCERQ